MHTSRVARHTRSLLAREPGWLREHRPRPGRREIWATIRAHPRSLWELAVYLVVVVAVGVTVGVVFGASSVWATTIPIGLAFLAAGLYVGKVETLNRRDIQARANTESDPNA